MPKKRKGVQLTQVQDSPVIRSLLGSKVWNTQCALKKSHSAGLQRRVLEQVAARYRDANKRKKPNKPKKPANSKWKQIQSLVPDLIFAQFPSFTSGIPNPKYYVPGTHPDLTKPFTTVGIGEFANPISGDMNVEFSAGRTFINGTLIEESPLPNSGTYLGLPFEWISSEASILQIIPLAGLVKQSGTLAVSAIVQCLITGTGLEVLSDLYILSPGLPTSTMSGFVGLAVQITLSVAAISGSGTSQNANNTVVPIMVGVDCDNNNPGTLLFSDCDFTNSDNPSRTSIVGTEIPVNSSTAHLLVEVNTTAVGIRAGINDPASGSVVAAFVNLDELRTINGYVPLFSCPIRLVSIYGYESQLRLGK